METRRPTTQDARLAVKTLLQYMGEDPTREGLIETPDRVVRSFERIYGGYAKSPSDVLKVFKEEHADGIVALTHIKFFSTCEHHMLPFHGECHVGYIPSKEGGVVGVSKLARIVDIFARRLQVQERLTAQIVDTLWNMLNPLGVICICEAQHLCMTSRGVENQTGIMKTSEVRGVFSNYETKQEFIALI